MLNNEISNMISNYFEGKTQIFPVPVDNALLDHSIEQISSFYRVLGITANIEEQIEYLLKIRTFDENRVKSLLARGTKYKVDFKSGKKIIKKTRKEKSISYKTMEDLEGFISSQGQYEWSNVKIDDFIKTLKHIQYNK